MGVVPAWGARLSRGLAIWEDKVIRATGDCRLIAINRASGKKVWESQVCDVEQYKTITGAPRVGDGKVFIGTSDGDSGVGRSHVNAFDAETGKHLWRFYTVPGDPADGFESPAMEMASKTWGKEYWKYIGGGGANAWEAMTYDPRTGLLIFGTDSAPVLSPLARGEGAGDELFTNAVVAVEADTGKYVWHYSTTPGDGWNFAATMPFVLADLPIEGKTTAVVMTAPKNGFFYVFDAATGALVNQPKPITTVNWASHIDMNTGRPVMLDKAKWWEKGPEGAVVYPFGMGAHNWQPMAFNPDAGLVFIPATDLATWYAFDPAKADAIGGGVEFDNYYNLRNGGVYKGKLVAWDPVKQAARWERDIGAPYQGGTLATAGNLVFQGTTEGQFAAYRADTGEPLWSFEAGAGILGAASTVEIDGRQLVLVATGSGTTSSVGFAPLLGALTGGPARLLAFALDGNAALPPPGPRWEGTVPKPGTDRPSPELVAAGKNAWDAAGCAYCHGMDAIGGPGSVPDLRRISAERLELLPQILREGILTSTGMPDYRELLTEQDVPAIRAYVVEQAWRGYLGGEANKQ
jgi:quinohemoprotein ethanol dehydrogenase